MTKTKKRPTHKLASELKKGDVVLIDCGYCGIDDMKACRVMSLQGKESHLFDDGYSLGFQVEICGTGEVFTPSFNPDHELEIAR